MLPLRGMEVILRIASGSDMSFDRGHSGREIAAWSRRHEGDRGVQRATHLAKLTGVEANGSPRCFSRKRGPPRWP